MEIISIFAIILGPIFAVQIDRFIERQRIDKNRRLDIFKTLMATRGAVLSYAHVEALNRIDLEFKGDKYKNVTGAWKIYFDNLTQKPEGESQSQIWQNNNGTYLTDLLYEMGKSLGYDFDKALIKRNVYSPVGHLRDEEDLRAIRWGLIDVLEGRRSVPITFIDSSVGDNQPNPLQEELQLTMLEYYKRELKK